MQSKIRVSLSVFKILKTSAVIFLISLFLTVSSSAFGKDTIKAVFINPDLQGNVFWDPVTQFMVSAAKDLGIDLKVMYSKTNRYRSHEIVTNLAKSPDKPDYLIYIPQAGVTLSILKTAEKAGMKSFMFNTDILKIDRKVVGNPRENFKNYIGHMVPNDVQAGYDLADSLINKAIKNNKKGKDGKIHLIGISGSRDSTASLDRNKGLKQYISKMDNVFLHQIVFAKWSLDEAREITQGLLTRYPETSVVWAASDGMSMGAVEAFKKVGKKPGKDLFTGGVDWSKEGVDSISKGEMSATVGGHFMEGGWIMVLLKDYHNGIDFKENGVKIKSRMQVISSENVQSYLKKLGKRNWDQIDFTKFSKVLNPKLKKYNFSLDAILEQ